MSASSGDPNDAKRKAKLDVLFNQVVTGKKPVSTSTQGNLFLESIRVQDPADCIQRLIAGALPTVQQCMRFRTDPTFLNGPAALTLKYLQNPDLKTIMGGDLLHQVLSKMVDPPIFWDCFVRAYKDDKLERQAQQCFAWLLLELVSLQKEKAAQYNELAQEDALQERLLNSPHLEVRNLGHRIKHIVSTTTATPLTFDGYGGPGGRHDNDFPDFRKITIMPTADEFRTEEKPFMRTAKAMEEACDDGVRLGIHLDNQFRLLREDMVAEMREELQIALGIKKKPHRGMILEGFKILGIECNPARQQPWGLKLQCAKDLPQLGKHKEPAKRKKFLITNKTFMKHLSQTCLIVDNEVVAFPCINRDEDLLAAKLPILLLQFSSNQNMHNAFLKLKTGRVIKLVQINTAVFAYEPILIRLQGIKEMELSDELLSWTEGTNVEQPSSVPDARIREIETNPSQDLRGLLKIKSPKEIRLDKSQCVSLLTALRQRVSLIQGPPGTGKSFIGALLAKIIHDSTDKTILVVCYTNHALDQFLEDLLDIGIPASSMVRLGAKSTARTKPLVLQGAGGRGLPRETYKVIDQLKSEARRLDMQLKQDFQQYISAPNQFHQFMTHLEFLDDDGPDWFGAFTVPSNDDGMVTVSKKGKAVDEYYLLDRWLRGLDAGIFRWNVTQETRGIWEKPYPDREAIYQRWTTTLSREQAHDISALAQEYNECQNKISRMYRLKDATVLREKRIIGCTTSAAAMKYEELQAANADVLLVEEAGEILESHILTALGFKTDQLILIGDHKQLRPKVSNYQLTVEKGDGYDLNRSLFERLVMKGFPHQTLTMQHRMRPEISSLIRTLTYPDLIDGPGTQQRPDIRGFHNGNLIFVSHDKPEDHNPRLGDKDGLTYKSSKQNTFEAEMVLKSVRYLGQQGYGTDKIVVLTPYLGQLQLLREKLSKDNDPVLNDLDSYDLVRAGLLPAASAHVTKNPIKISSIDNYQGEESEIVIASLTRSNDDNDIGFMSAPERLNVLLSRAQNGLILIGNPETFLHARKGKEMWTRFFDLLKVGGFIHDGLPAKCERHPDRKTFLRKPQDFDDECPDGGCTEPCGTILSCGVHKCPQHCHQLSDHSKMPCEFVTHAKCDQGHPYRWKCHKGPPVVCEKCERERLAAEKRQQRDFELQQQREAAQKEHLRQLVLLDEEIERKRQEMKDEQDRIARENAIEQKKRDLQNAAFAAIAARRAPIPPPQQPTLPSSPQDPATQQPPRVPPLAPLDPSTNTPPTNPSTSTTPAAVPPATAKPHARPRKLVPDPVLEPSDSEKEWRRQKAFENANNKALDTLMDMTGLENVKEQVLNIKAKIDVSLRQNVDFKNERFGVVMLGNPGTGKTTVARLYAEFLNTYQGVLPGSEFVETTGSRLANDGVPGAKKIIDDIQKAGGGAVFLDEAYQLTEKQSTGGAQVLDFLLAEIENNVGKIVFLFAGYTKEMESFFEHNPGIPSRIPYTLKFEDYKDPELHLMLRKMIDKWYGGRMKVEEGMGGLYMRIVVRRLGRGRGRNGFGNARGLANVFAKIRERQGVRLTRETRDGKISDDFFFTREDLIGPNPAEALGESEAWNKLKELIGLQTVKQSVQSMVDMIHTNYLRELSEKEPIRVPLNRVFLGSPGTGKTTVAKYYGQVLNDLGMLSNGEVVVKNPSDFIGGYIGHSESQTKGILATTVGKVLVIDEAYSLYSGGGGVGNQSDPFKTAVIDTLVAEVQSIPGEDRCVLLLGYEEQMNTMFQNVNPGLARRFAIDDAFHFLDFTNAELREILDLKLKHQGLDATPEAKDVACELLDRCSMRPNFGNAGEVENMLSKAKTNFQTRQSKKPPAERAFDVVFEPEDFDPEFARGASATLNCRKLFEDVIGCEDIVAKLEGYQQIAINAKAKGIPLHELIPTNFIFKGPPGTGKTTTARKMGQVYYDMGFLSTAKVVECSATDLIGQYVGQTGPKTKKQLEKALGQVLFVDEAYRLAEGHFATEAVNELVDILTKPQFLGKMIVILAGYDDDMNRLLSVNSGLSSRFPEEVQFTNLSPEHCLQVMASDIGKKNITVDFLQDQNSPGYVVLRSLIGELTVLPSWGNARDMKTLAKKMIGFVYKTPSSSGSAAFAPELSARTALECVKQLLVERRGRANLPANRTPQFETSKFAQTLPPLDAPPPPSVAPRTATAPPPPRAQKQKDAAEVPPSPQDDGRDPGVSDAVWNELQACKAAEEKRLREAQEAIAKKQAEFRALAAKEAVRKRVAEELARLEAAALKAKDDAALEEIKRKQETLRLTQLRARIEGEKAARELERIRELEKKRRQQEAQVQQKLRAMGVCVAGYQWQKTSNGWRCAGGSHFISDAQLESS